MNEDEGMCTPVFKPVKHTHELRSNVNAMNKKMKTSVYVPTKNLNKGGRKVQLMAQFRIFPSSESRHSFVANYTSAVKFKIHILVLFCCIIIPLYVSERKYL